MRTSKLLGRGRLAIQSCTERFRESPKLLLRAIAILICISALPQIAFAATLTVNTTDDPGTSSQCSLRAAINNANNKTSDSNSTCAAGTGADTIVFNVSGQITLGVLGTLPAIANTLTIDGSGHTITIDGASSYRVMQVNAGATVSLNKLTIADGNATSDIGGGVLNQGSLTITDCVFSSNSAYLGAGGGIANYNSSGAAAVLTVTDSIFSGNLAAAGTGGGSCCGGGGAGIFSQGVLNVVVVTNSTFSDNHANSGDGAGIFKYSGTLTVTNSTFANNRAGEGGGISDFFESGQINNSTFYGNFGGYVGGGIFKNFDEMSISNSTIVNNYAGTNGGGIFSYQAPITITNSILSGNFFRNCAAGNPIGGFNISDDGTCGFGTGDNVQNIGLDPNGLQNNGGPTQTIALLTGSPAIDAIPLANCPATDQRGFPRPAAGHTACDVGAYEYASTLDATPPAISIVAPTASSYLLNQSIAASYTCTDTDDAVSLCSGTVANGANIDTASIGAKTFTVNTSDSHNNSASQTVNYDVAYKMCTDYDTLHAKQRGSTVPIKLEICDANNVNKSTSSIVLHATAVIMVSNNASEPLADSGNANPDDDFRFITGPEYIFNLSTSGYPAGTFALQFTVSGDPTTHSALFQLK